MTSNRLKIRLELTRKLEGGGRGGEGEGEGTGWMSRLENATEQPRYLNWDLTEIKVIWCHLVLSELLP